jgi:hypothetical protein
MVAVHLVGIANECCHCQVLTWNNVVGQINSSLCWFLVDRLLQSSCFVCFRLRLSPNVFVVRKDHLDFDVINVKSWEESIMGMLHHYVHIRGFLQEKSLVYISIPSFGPYMQGIHKVYTMWCISRVATAGEGAVKAICW